MSSNKNGVRSSASTPREGTSAHATLFAPIEETLTQISALLERVLDGTRLEAARDAIASYGETHPDLRDRLKLLTSRGDTGDT